MTIRDLSGSKSAEWLHQSGILSKITDIGVLELLSCTIACSLQHLHHITSVRAEWRPERFNHIINVLNQGHEWLSGCKSLMLSNELKIVIVYSETLKQLLSISQDHYNAALGLGDAHFFTKMYRQSLKYYIMAGNLESEFFTDFGIPKGIVQSMNKMIGCFIGLKKYDQATILRQFISTKETYVEMYNTVQQFGLYFNEIYFDYIYDISILELLICMLYNVFINKPFSHYH